MGTFQNHSVTDGGTSPALVEAPRLSVLEALEGAINSLEQFATGGWISDAEKYKSVLNEYRRTAGWARQRMTMFIVTDDDVQSFARDKGLGTPLTLDELHLIQRGVDAGLRAVRDECLDAAVGCVIDDRFANSGCKT